MVLAHTILILREHADTSSAISTLIHNSRYSIPYFGPGITASRSPARCHLIVTVDPVDTTEERDCRQL